MDSSPFPYQGPLEPDEVTGRDEVVADLVERITERRVTALLGPRRYGKTSVLRRVGADLEAAGTQLVWVDLYEVRSMADVAIRFDDGLSRAQGGFGEAAASVAASLAVNLGVLRVELSRPQRPDAALTFEALLDVLVRAAASNPTALVIDEFSGIARVDAAAGVLRTHLQHHYRDLGIVFCGSEPSMMRTLFTDRAEPFHGQADLLELGPLDAPAVAAIVGDGFRSTGRDPGNLASLLYAFTSGHPQRTMQLADATWRAAVPGEPFHPDRWADGLDAVRRSSASANERLFSLFNEGEKAVLRIVASGGRIFGRAADVLELPAGTAQTARASLLAEGDLVADEAAVGTGGYRLVDPVFADWIRHRFPL